MPIANTVGFEEGFATVNSKECAINRKSDHYPGHLFPPVIENTWHEGGTTQEWLACRLGRTLGRLETDKGLRQRLCAPEPETP